MTWVNYEAYIAYEVIVTCKDLTIHYGYFSEYNTESIFLIDPQGEVEVIEKEKIIKIRKAGFE